MKEIIRWSTKRARSYKRHFDHDKARQMLAQPGMTARKVAAHFGVSKSAILKMKNSPTKDKPVVFPQIYTCPRCFGYKGRESKVCKTCHGELSIAPMHPIYHPPERVQLDKVEEGRIINYRGNYGVVVSREETPTRRVNFWDGPDERIDAKEEVVVMEWTEWTSDS
jgi:hypothetical protein